MEQSPSSEANRFCS